MPKHDEPTGRGRLNVSTMDTAMGLRLFVWDNDGKSLGMMTFQKAFTTGVFGADPNRFDCLR